jgi:hypothetical protein
VRTILKCAPLILAGCQSASDGQAETPEWREIEGEPILEVLPRDAIPSIDAPVYVTAAEADAYYLPDEPVLGVVGRDGTARAYSAWHLDAHEIVNDEIDGEPIAATW